jgi:hypothetical protein
MAGPGCSRAAAGWTQQGAKLVGTPTVGSQFQGTAVALSGDGNTAIVGGLQDNGAAGAAWVFARSGGVWAQQGSKLVGTGTTGSTAAQQGRSVALSADGNTAIVGGNNDGTQVGAAWVYTRTGGVWTQQGSKLVGTGNVGASLQGFSVELAPGGNMAIVGGRGDNPAGTVAVGAAWVFTRSGGGVDPAGQQVLRQRRQQRSQPSQLHRGVLQHPRPGRAERPQLQRLVMGVRRFDQQRAAHRHA